MLDRDTVIRDPHDVVVTREEGRTKRRTIDPRLSVEMQDEGAALTLFFDRDTAYTGEARLLEVRLTPTAGGTFEPWNLMPDLSLRLTYARARLAWEHHNAAAALRALRQISSTRRGLSDAFLRIVAQLHESLVAEGEPYPVKALAKTQQVDKSTASRWVTAARARGLLGKEHA